MRKRASAGSCELGDSNVSAVYTSANSLRYSRRLPGPSAASRPASARTGSRPPKRGAVPRGPGWAFRLVGIVTTLAGGAARAPFPYTMANKLARTLVSKQKRRYREGGFDLDLTYITGVDDGDMPPPPGYQAVPNIIAMGIPSEGVEGQFRNPMSEVVRFFEEIHPDASKICNLCIEDTRQYDPGIFSGIVASYPFADHNCPPLMLLPAFCKGADEWLKMGAPPPPPPSRVARAWPKLDLCVVVGRQTKRMSSRSIARLARVGPA